MLKVGRLQAWVVTSCSGLASELSVSPQATKSSMSRLARLTAPSFGSFFMDYLSYLVEMFLEPNSGLNLIQHDSGLAPATLVAVLVVGSVRYAECYAPAEALCCRHSIYATHSSFCGYR